MSRPISRALASDVEKPTVKQHLAAIRMLFDWLVTGQVVATNPAHAVRGPKHVVKTGKTTVLDAEQARKLLDSIDTSTVVGLRDRALISVMTFAFARIGAVVAMRVEDYYPKGKRWWVRLHEKGGKRHEMPAHHKLEAYLDAYIEAAGIRDGGKSPPLPLRRRPHRHADREADEPRRCLAHDPAPRRRARHARQDRLPHLPRDRHHGLSRSRRHAGKRPGHGRARKPAHDQALRPHRRRDHARRGGADYDLSSYMKCPLEPFTGAKLIEGEVIWALLVGEARHRPVSPFRRFRIRPKSPCWCSPSAARSRRGR